MWPEEQKSEEDDFVVTEDKLQGRRSFVYSFSTTVVSHGAKQSVLSIS